MAAPSTDLFDIRTVERNIFRGLVDQKDHQKWLDGLEDCVDMAEESETVYVHAVADDEDDASGTGDD